jgi:uncharacterized membrane protein YbhN (UPF0104 family)
MLLTRDGAALAPALDRAIRAIVLLVIVGAASYLAWAAYLGWTDLTRAVARLGVIAILLGLVIAAINYLLRFMRWRDLLRRLGQGVPDRHSLPVYVAGLALTATPGKAGETIRSALLLHWGVPVSASLTAFVVDRLTDVIGVLLLAALTGESLVWWLLAGGAIVAGMLAHWLCRTAWAANLADRLGRRGHVRIGQLMRAIARHYASAWRVDCIAIYVVIAMLAYGIQALVFAGFAARLWPEATWRDSVHVFLTSTFAGAATMLPGGLGAMEVALIAQMNLRGMPLADATVAALAVRAVTLWFAIFLGLTCLLWFRRHVAAPSNS